MPVVPVRPGNRQQAPAPPMPNDVYTLMAAAQMHSEGRLIQPTGGVDDKLNSIPDSAKGPIQR